MKINILSKTRLIILSLFLTSCASSTDWATDHFRTTNQAQRCDVLCKSGQYVEANKYGCVCREKENREAQKRAVSSSTSSAYGNYNVINVNQSGANYRTPAQDMTNMFRVLYEQERNNRLNRICTYNGTCK